MISIRTPGWLARLQDYSYRRVITTDPSNSTGRRRQRGALAVGTALLCCLALLLSRDSSVRSGLSSYAYPPTRSATRPASLAGGEGPDTLQARAVALFDALEARSILEYAESLAQESEPGRCPETWRQSNRDMLKNEGEHVWPTMTAEVLKKARKETIDRVKERFGWQAGGRPKDARELEEMLGEKGRRGIVATAGNQDTGRRLLTTIRILRKHHHCTLPIEIWGFPDELANLGAVRSEIDSLGGEVSWRTVEIEKRQGKWKQFHIKGEVLARSSFSELLYLDSDSIPLTDPSFLFDSPTFKQHGAVFWPDFNRDPAANPIWRLIGNLHCTPARAWQVETGQVLFDKRARGGLNLVALEIARAMQDDEEFWFRLSGGDKDTFRYAFYLLSLPYSMAPHYPSSLGSTPSSGFEGHRFCGHTMLHYGLDPDQEWSRLRQLPEWTAGAMITPEEEQHAPPLFVHANVLKHSGYNNNHGDTFLQLKKPVDDRLFHPGSAKSVREAPLSAIRQIGYSHRGICVDIWDSSAHNGAGEQEQGAREGAYEEGSVEVIDWRAAFGGIFAGFEDMYYDEGGVAGAW